MATWKIKAAAPTARWGVSVATVGGLVYVIGGTTSNGAGMTKVEAYDPATDTWATKASLPAPRFNMGVAVLDGIIYAVCGASSGTVVSSNVYAYDPGADSWTSKISQMQPRQGCGVAVLDGIIYVVSGALGNGAITTRVDAYDPIAGTTTVIASLPTGRKNLTAVVAGGLIYAIGGASAQGAAFDTVEAYDPVAGTWSTKTSMPTARTALASSVIGSTIYAIGGLASNAVLGNVESYNPATGAWTTQSSLLVPRSGLGAVAIGLGLYAAAGATGSGTTASSVNEYWVNSAPNAPTLTAPASGQVIDRATTNRLAWVVSDSDVGDSQSKFDLRYRLVGSPTWTDVTGTTPNAFWDAAPGTFALGDFEWQARTYDSQGLVGPYSSSSFFTASETPATPTITAPVNGATVGSSETISWSTPAQARYQVRRVADNAGSPDTSTVYWDTGEVVDATTRTLTASFSTNDRWEWVQVRVKAGGLWSAWAAVRVQVSWTPPASPTVTLTPNPTTVSIAVAITNPTPAGGEPSVSYNDVYLSAPGVPEWRAATFVPPNSAWVFWTPTSGLDYTARVVAVAANGTTAEGTAS